MKKKILVIQQKMIGDVLTSTIIFEALRKRYPTAVLHYLIQPHTLPVVENNPFINRVIKFDPEKFKGITGLLNFSKKIRAERYHIIIDVYAKINSAMITWLSGAGARISYNKWYTSMAYTRTFQLNKEPFTKAGVAIENRMLLLQGIDKDFPLEIKPKIYLTEEERSRAQQQLINAGIDLEKPLFMIAILGSSSEKTYPYMAEILDFVATHCDTQLIFNYNPKQESEARTILEYCQRDTLKKAYIGVFGTSLREFISLTSHCDALIGNEGGAVNMAKAINIPTFSIFSPQIEKKVWAVYQDEFNVAVHIDDFTDKADRIPEADRYKMFKPAYFLPQLNNFLDKVIKP